MKLVFIEDEINTNRLLVENLKTIYDVEWLKTSTDAITYLQKNHDFEVVILDLMMPAPEGVNEVEGVNIELGYAMGLGLLKLINNTNPNAKIIIFSARNDFDNDKLKGFKFDEKLLKPKRVEELIEEIEIQRKKTK